VDDPLAALLPYATTPKRLALDVVAALEGCAAVGRVALFGSIAAGRHDGFSDIDVLCEVADEAGAWVAAHAVRVALPVRWHGPFSGVPLPSGRHWLEGESLFHLVDLSYNAPGEYERILREGMNGVAVHAVEVVTRAPQQVAAPDTRLEAVSAEREFTHALYMLVKHMRAYLRGEGEWEALAARMRNLEAAALPDSPAGGDAGSVMLDARTLYGTLMMERAKYGGEP
jgi:predicted nucleotidyltransferase